jgi:hypothetical protein
MNPMLLIFYKTAFTLELPCVRKCFRGVLFGKYGKHFYKMGSQLKYAVLLAVLWKEHILVLLYHVTGNQERQINL